MNVEIFFNSVRKFSFGGNLLQSRVDGLNALLAAFDKFASKIPMRQYKSYMLGTVYWETAFSMEPVREIGGGRGRSYGHPAGPWHQVYYGRGDVQLTWRDNYAHATAELKKAGILSVDQDLVKTPDLTLKPDIAGAILVLGMTEGWFTGKKLADYFHPAPHGTVADWPGARKIINGTDHALQIAMIAMDFDKAFVAAEAPDVPTS